MFGERLKRARSAVGLTMKELAFQAGVSANMIKKYEHNQSMPSSGVLIKISRALNVRSEYFFRPARYELDKIEYRKHSTASPKLLRRIKADVLEQAERWMELTDLWPNFPVQKCITPTLSFDVIDDYQQLEEVADQVRSQWELGSQRIVSIIDVLESKGILVIVTDVDTTSKFDGLQASIGTTPIIVISSKWPGDRQRFTLAHELGHLLLEGKLSASLEEEKACNRFAGAFLFPQNSVRRILGNSRKHLEPKELYLLKMDYGLSMMACVYRATDLGIISPAKRKEMFLLFSAHKWRNMEPGEPYPIEKTTTFKQLVYRGLGEGILSESKAAELLGMSVINFHRSRKLESSNADSY